MSPVKTFESTGGLLGALKFWTRRCWGVHGRSEYGISSGVWRPLSMSVALLVALTLLMVPAINVHAVTVARGARPRERTSASGEETQSSNNDWVLKILMNRMNKTAEWKSQLFPGKAQQGQDGTPNHLLHRFLLNSATTTFHLGGFSSLFSRARKQPEVVVEHIRNASTREKGLSSRRGREGPWRPKQTRSSIPGAAAHASQESFLNISASGKPRGGMWRAQGSPQRTSSPPVQEDFDSTNFWDNGAIPLPWRPNMHDVTASGREPACVAKSGAVYAYVAAGVIAAPSDSCVAHETFLLINGMLRL